jgi:hypothetical protein
VRAAICIAAAAMGLSACGGGVRVGVISTGVVNLASYQVAGVLPAGIYISQNTAGALDEGSWMLELVHQHAPDALLGFCDGVDLDFNGCVQDLGNNFHADIIVDDILFSGQFYPDVTAASIAQLETANDRMVFVHLSGNEQNGGYWQGSYVPTAAIIAGAQTMLLDFGIASGGASDAFNAITLPAAHRLRLILNWNDPPHDPANRALTAYLLDANSQVLTQMSSESDPTLLLDYTNATGAAQVVRLAVSLDSGSARGLVVQVTEGSVTCNIECQPLAHASSGLAGGSIGDIADALVVGATFALSPRTLEAWSNHGPFRIEFQAAAVPSIAGAVALLESAGFNRTQVLKALRSTAVPLGPATWDAGYGFGLADAAAALRSGGN